MIKVGDSVVYRYVEKGTGTVESWGIVIGSEGHNRIQMLDMYDGIERCSPPCHLVGHGTGSLNVQKRIICSIVDGKSATPSCFTWVASAQTDQNNIRWALLRSVEWGRWPLFLSQAVVPILFLFYPWGWVLGVVVAANVAWWVAGAFIGVSVRLAYLGSFTNQIKWVIWLPCTILLFLWSRSPESWISCFYFLLVFPLGMFPPVRTKPLQLRFMEAMGYEKSQLQGL